MSKYYTTTLQKGSKGNDVSEWQKFLNSLGYNLTVDGDFGDKTYAATTDYQTKNGLTVDGIVGAKTWGKAGYSPYSTLTTPTDKPTTNPLPTAPTYDTTNWDDTTKGKTALDSYNTAKKDVNKHGEFSYDDYVMGDDAQGAKDALDAHNANKPGAYQSQWQSQLDALMNSIMNRDKFSYNMNEDALYQQAVNRYQQMGKTAMADTIGQASAMTGGYGNSYAASVGNQAYQSYLQEAHDMLPEFYQMALDRYNQEGQDLYNQYGLVADRENTDYGRYRDTVSDFMNEREYLQGVYSDERSFDYSKYMDDRNLAYNLHQDEYQKLLDSLNIAQSDYYNGADMFHSEQSNKNNIAGQKFSDEMNIWNANTEEAWKQAQWDEAARQYANDQYWKQKQFDAQYGSSGSSSSSSSGSGSDNGGNKGKTPSGVDYDNGSVSTEDIKAMQKALGIDADGKWGPDSIKAAEGLTADEAYRAWKNGMLGNKPDLGPTKKWTTNDQSKTEENQIKNGGSYYYTALKELKAMKAEGVSYSEMVAFVKEALDSNYLTTSEYMTLVQAVRNMR